MNLIYCYDAYCCWSYGFQSVLKKFLATYQEEFSLEILSGGLVISPKPVHISATAEYFNTVSQEVSKKYDIHFGEDFLWHIHNPSQSDWFPNSEKPAMALAYIKIVRPEIALDFAMDMQYALFEEGRDLTDDEAYRHLIEKYQLAEKDFMNALHNKLYKEMAYAEFGMVEKFQLKVFPLLLASMGVDKYFVLANGFIDFESLKDRFLTLRAELNN